MGSLHCIYFQLNLTPDSVTLRIAIDEKLLTIAFCLCPDFCQTTLHTHRDVYPVCASVQEGQGEWENSSELGSSC